MLMSSIGKEYSPEMGVLRRYNADIEFSRGTRVILDLSKRSNQKSQSKCCEAG